MKKHIPNTITLINLFCGACAVVYILNSGFIAAFWLLVAGGLADFADGFVARWLKVKSELGKELDSLADMISFGMAPGAIMYILLQQGQSPDLESNGIAFFALPVFLLTVFSGLRLAKFNLDTRQAENFIGLPTPAATVYVVGLMLIYHFDSFGLKDFVSNMYFIYANVVVLSFLLVSEIPMFSLKFSGADKRGNRLRIAFLAVALILVIFFKEAAFALIMLIYGLINLGLCFISFLRRSEI